MLQTEEEGAGVLEILVCYSISFCCRSGREGKEKWKKGGKITADVLMRS